jgi:hypothetical protein
LLARLYWTERRNIYPREVTPVGLCRRGRWWHESGIQNYVAGSVVLYGENSKL